MLDKLNPAVPGPVLLRVVGGHGRILSASASTKARRGNAAVADQRLENGIAATLDISDLQLLLEAEMTDPDAPIDTLL